MKLYAAETDEGYSVRSCVWSRVTIDLIRLTIMSDIDGSARVENGEDAGIIKACGIRGAVLGLGTEAESMSTRVCMANRRAIYHCTVEQWVRTSGISDVEGVPREGVQNTTRIIEEFEGLVAGVDDGRGDFQVLQSIDIDVGGRDLNGQTGVGRDGDHRGDDGDEGSTKGRGEHCDVGREGIGET